MLFAASEIIVFEAPLDLKFNKFKTIQAISDQLSDFAANLSGKIFKSSYRFIKFIMTVYIIQAF